ncbi:MAG TPA: UDP-2,3-diacylglucosamine diphosphatase LpxI [Candidatus Omnitrophota bacterium]|nr:UDP-2,3-diacylglucosamine diphosphatase LpxI [Candidatus Omnitrophota bacterium]HRZ15746.1 UDP-2,3-diacylglucosamine diphosphatase LpxI [Candidatus Omnitrophota bacterium]
MERIGLIAGNRRFPIVFAQAARKARQPVVAIAIKGETSRQLARLVEKVYWLSLKDFDRLFDIFQSEGITRVVMAGQISPFRLFSREVRESRSLQKLLAAMKDRKANTIFSSIAGQMEKAGIQLIDSTTFLQDQIPGVGVLTRRQPTAEEWADVRFGYELAKKIADLDIGLTIGVKNKAVVGVEALEGTDNLIRRAGRIARGNLVVIKVGRTGQDMRFDIPVVGLQTVKTLVKAGASCLAMESGTTLILDRQEVIRLADARGIALVAVKAVNKNP